MNSVLTTLCLGISIIVLGAVLQLLQLAKQPVESVYLKPRSCVDSSTIIGTTTLHQASVMCEPNQDIEIQELEFGSVLVVCRCSDPLLSL